LEEVHLKKLTKRPVGSRKKGMSRAVKNFLDSGTCDCLMFTYNAGAKFAKPEKGGD